MVKGRDTKLGTRRTKDKTSSSSTDRPELEHKIDKSASQGSALDYDQAGLRDGTSQSTNVKASALTKHYPVIHHRHSPRVETSSRNQNIAGASLTSATKRQAQSPLQAQPSNSKQTPPSPPRLTSTSPSPSSSKSQAQAQAQSQSSAANMSKLSPALKQLINAPFAKPAPTTPTLSTLQPTLSKLVASAQSHNVSTPAWLTFTTATAMTMNSPQTLTAIYQTATSSNNSHSTLTPLLTAELQREVGLKCISFNGIPRSINCLGAYHSSLPQDIKSQLSTTATREVSPQDTQSITQRKSDGLSLWDSVYAGFERKLLSKLSQSHPDLPVHIINSHYANLLSNPSRTSYTDGTEKPRETHVGRVLTSLVAIACLRAQTGVAPQVVSHIFGLRKAYENGDAEAEGEVEVGGGKWLSGEEGNRWLLEWIDELVRAIGTRQEGEGEEQRQTDSTKSPTTFAPGMDQGRIKAKL